MKSTRAVRPNAATRRLVPSRYRRRSAAMSTSSTTAAQHRLGDERRDEPQPQQAGGHTQHPRDQRQTDRQRDEPLRPRVRVGGDDPGRQGSRRRHRAHDEVAGAAEHRVEHERGDRGVQPHHRRHPGDGGVRQGLGDQDGPHGEPGDEVCSRPRSAVAVQRREEPPEAVGSSACVHRPGRRHGVTMAKSLSPGRTTPSSLPIADSSPVTSMPVWARLPEASAGRACRVVVTVVPASVRCGRAL